MGWFCKFPMYDHWRLISISPPVEWSYTLVLQTFSPTSQQKLFNWKIIPVYIRVWIKNVYSTSHYGRFQSEMDFVTKFLHFCFRFKCRFPSVLYYSGTLQPSSDLSATSGADYGSSAVDIAYWPLNYLFISMLLNMLHPAVLPLACAPPEENWAASLTPTTALDYKICSPSILQLFSSRSSL